MDFCDGIWLMTAAINPTFASPLASFMAATF